MTTEQKLQFYDLIKRCQDTVEDGGKLFGIASYDRPEELVKETGEPLHIDYILIGKDACFAISKKEREVLEAFLSEPAKEE